MLDHDTMVKIATVCGGYGVMSGIASIIRARKERRSEQASNLSPIEKKPDADFTPGRAKSRAYPGEGKPGAD